MPNHDLDRLAHWRALITEQVQSGLSIQAFCQQRTIGKSRFHSWKSILTTLDTGTQSKPKPKDTPVSATFVPVHVVPDTLVEVVLPNGVQLRLPLAADVEHVARLVKAVRSC